MRNWAASECGATSIEYALIASLLSIVIITGVTAVGTKLSTFYGSVSANLK